jgi:flagellar motor switch/type III secretory pathway protein FliN
MRRIRRTLGELLQRTVRVELIDGGDETEAPATAGSAAHDMRDTAFGVDLSLAGTDVLLAIDQALARMLVDDLTADVVQLRGSGPLTDAELGVLDFAVLAALDGLMRNDDVPATLSGTLSPKQTQAWIEQRREARPAAMTFTVEIAGRQGRATLWLTDQTLAAMLRMSGDAAGEWESPARADEAVTLRLALPPLSLSPRQWQRASPGDVILLNAVALENLAGCRLVSDTGWSVAPVRVERDSATLVSVRCGTPRPRIEPALSAKDAGDVVLQPTLGEVSLTLEELSRWRVGQFLDLPKDVRMPLSLSIGTTRVGGGEAVRIDGEIGLRLTQVNRPPGESTAAGE